MSTQNLIQFLKSIAASPHLKARIGTRVSYADFLAIARDHGFDLDDISLQQAADMIEAFGQAEGVPLEIVKCSADRKK